MQTRGAVTPLGCSPSRSIGDLIMVAVNSTQNTAKHVPQAFDLMGQISFQSEKISCSFSGSPAIDPLNLLGRHVLFDEYCPALGSVPSQVLQYRARVVAVQVGSPAFGVESLLLLRHDGCDAEEYSAVSRLTVLSLD